MRYSYFLYGVLASLVFLIFMGVITDLLGISDFTCIAICIILGTIITCTLYILESINDLKKDLNKINDIQNKNN